MKTLTVNQLIFCLVAYNFNYHITRNNKLIVHTNTINLFYLPEYDSTNITNYSLTKIKSFIKNNII